MGAVHAKKVVLAYSGGLDTSAIVPWLVENVGCEVIAFVADVGQGEDELAGVEEKARNSGASECHVVDLRQEFIEEYVFPTMITGAVYEGKYLLGTSMARPIIAKKQVEVARKVGADAVSHGCTGKGNDQVRFEVSVRALRPGTRVIAPAREWGLTRAEAIAAARARNLPVPVAATGPFGTDTNLWGRSIQCGVIEDLSTEPPEEVYAITRPHAACPDIPAYVDLRFEAGVPVAINDVAMSLLELIGSLETIAGTHGVGRLDLLENRVVGIKTREVYEAPAAVVLHTAHRELQAMVMSRDFHRLAQTLAVRYADLVYDGLWFTPEREAIDAFVQSAQRRVTGTIRVKLFKGQCAVVGRHSPHALYDRSLATYGDGDTFDHAAAAGFITLFGLPAELAARRAPRPEAGS